MKNELLPCPFCGGEAKLHAAVELDNKELALYYEGKVGIHCIKCHVATGLFTSEIEATASWNRRVIQSEK